MEALQQPLIRFFSSDDFIALLCFNKMSSKALSPASSPRDGAEQRREKSNLENDDLGELPLYAQAVREGLLDFDHFLELQVAMLVNGNDGEDDIPLSAYKPDGEAESQRAREREFVESAHKFLHGKYVIYIRTLDMYVVPDT